MGIPMYDARDISEWCYICGLQICLFPLLLALCISLITASASIWLFIVPFAVDTVETARMSLDS